MIYVDTNVIIYAIENHPKYGKSCKRILQDIEDKKLEASCSMLVLVELIGVIKKINDLLSKEGKKGISIEQNVDAVISLPFVWIDLDFMVAERASTYDFGVNGSDYVHIASMELNSINEVLSADKDLDGISIVRRVDPLDYRTARS